MELGSSSGGTREELCDRNLAIFDASAPPLPGAGRHARRWRRANKSLRPFASLSSPEGRELRAYRPAVDPALFPVGFEQNAAFQSQRADRFAGYVTRCALDFNGLGRPFSHPTSVD